MDVESFAAKRQERLLLADKELREFVREALTAWDGEGEFHSVDLQEAVEVIWLEHFTAEAPRADYERFLPRFREILTESLSKTSAPTSTPPADHEVERVTVFLGTLAVNDGTMRGAGARGVRFKRWTSMHDSSVRHSHGVADGQVRGISEAFSIDGVDLQYPGHPVGPPEGWINCVPGSTQVAGAGQSVLSLTRREGGGTLIQVRTADGHDLSITPNHPVLTPAGYVPAQFLRPGDEVMATRLAVAPEVADAPPRIEELYRSARETGNTSRMTGGGVDFHGDGAESEVEVVWPNRDLPLEQWREFGEGGFVLADGGEVALVGPGLAVADATIETGGMAIGAGGLTASGVGLGRVVASLLRRQLPHPQAVRLAAGSNRQAEGIQVPGYDVAADAELVRHLEHAVAAGMTPSEVISVEVYSSGHEVYNLHTSSNWYTANGIAVHNCRCMVQPAAARGDSVVTDTTLTLSDDFDARSNSLTAAANAEDTGVGVFLLPEASDPIVEASSEPAHLTTVWLGDMNDLEEDTIAAIRGEVAAYAAELDGPVVVPVAERGTLGKDDADVIFLERTESLLALREGLIAACPTVKQVMDGVQQFPEWTPHVTMGYPETPATGEYDGDAVSFDRVGLWIGPNQHDFVMGGEMTAKTDSLLAAARAKVASFDMAGVIADVDDPELDEMPVDELEDGEELITEIPVHGVATLEGKATGDGRGFRAGAISLGAMPQPLGYEYTSTHGGDTSNVAVVGRIDEYFTVPAPHIGEGVFEVRWRGVIMPGKEYGARAIESIVDGSYTGLSVIVDSITVDVTDERERLLSQFKAERDAEFGSDVAGNEVPKGQPRTDEELEALVDEWVGDGSTQVTWFSAARVRRFDMVPTGAFQEGYIALGHEFADEMTPEQIEAAATALQDCDCDMAIIASAGAPVIIDLTVLTPEQVEEYDALGEEEQVIFAREHGAIIASAYAPGTKDGPGWITHPVPTSRIRRYWVRGKGAAKIAWGTPGDFNRCRTQLAKYVQNPEWLAGLCANMHKEAIGVWPGQEGGGRHGLQASATAPAPIAVLAEAPSSLVADGRTIYPASAFAEPTEDRPYALRIDREARTISGYAAAWDSCHIGIAGLCQQAPPSSTDYAFFRKGVVDTDSGEQAVGLITAGIGHAGDKFSPAAATAHYDQTDAVRAYINIGENIHGIWYAGVIPPHVTDAQIDELRAIGRVSGDWRAVTGRAGELEMVGLVSVNTEGFQLTASAAIGIGALDKGEGESDRTTFSEGAITINRDDMVGIALAAAEQALALSRRQEIIDRVTPARAIVANHLLAAARAELNTHQES